MNARAMVVRILAQFDRRRGGIESLIEQAFSRSRIDHRDRRFVFESVYGVLRYRIRLDHIIRHHLDEPGLVKQGELMRILQFGAYQVLHMDRVPNHAAVNESVKLAKADSSTVRFAGVVNAVLRGIIRSRGNVPAPEGAGNLSLRLSLESAHPEWLVRRWLDRYGLGDTRKLLAFNNRVPDTYLRRRVRGIGRQQFESESRILCDPVGGFGNLYYRLSRRSVLPEDIRLFQQGMCTVQAPSAGWVVALLDVRSGQRCLDLCSAPGGKAALMAELTGDTGNVYACDVDPVRLRRTVETVERMRLEHVCALVCDSCRPPFVGRFDRVLLDAPCTGTGVLHRHPDMRLLRTAEDIARIVPTQEALLEGAAGLVKPNGLLVYATCSLEPEENEQLVAAFLQRHPEFTAERPPQSIPAQFVDLDGHVRVTPFEHAMDGAYAVRLRRSQRSRPGRTEAANGAA
jgi:16S rRNA (cytosine967-C5)-methyltransferase